MQHLDYSRAALHIGQSCLRLRSGNIQMASFSPYLFLFFSLLLLVRLLTAAQIVLGLS